MEKLETRKEILTGPDGKEFTYEHWEYKDLVDKINEIIEYINKLEKEK